MATGTNAIAVFQDLSIGVAGSYYSMNKLKAITNQELKDYTIFKYDSSNLTKCVKYSSILFPSLTDVSRGTNLVSCNVALRGTKIVYRIPAKDNKAFSATWDASTTTEGVYSEIKNLREGVEIQSTQYTFTVNNSEIQGTFKVYINKDSSTSNRLSIQILRDTAITLNAQEYTHTIYNNTIPYLTIYLKTKAVQGETITYSISFTFSVEIYHVISS